MTDIISKIKFKREYPFCFNEYLKNKGLGFISFNAAIDDLLFRFGLGVVLQQVFSETDKFLGYTSYIKVYQAYSQKFVNPIADVKVIEDYKKFKSSEKAQKQTTICALDLLEDNLRMNLILK